MTLSEFRDRSVDVDKVGGDKVAGMSGMLCLENFNMSGIFVLGVC